MSGGLTWAQADEDLLREHYGRLTAPVIAQMLGGGRTVKAVREHARRMGLSTPLVGRPRAVVREPLATPRVSSVFDLGRALSQ